MPTSDNPNFMRVWRTILGFVEMYLTGGQPVSEVPDKPAVPSGHPDVAQTLSNLAGHYRDQAEKGDPNAQYKLAMALWHQGANFFDKEVLEWFEKAADQGHAEAQYELGSNIMEGDLPRSKSWLLAASEQGHAKACMELCHLELEFGVGEPEGIKWYRRARELGHPHDASTLGIYPPIEKPTSDSSVSGVKNRAKRGVTEDQYLLGCWYAKGDPPFHRNFIRAYAWFVVAAGFRPGETQRTWSYSQDWGTPMRAVCLLEQVLFDDERRLAHRLANYYAEKFGQQEGL